MTLNDLLKRVDIEKDRDKMFILRDKNGGWDNVNFAIQDNEIIITPDCTRPFSSDNDVPVLDGNGEWANPNQDCTNYTYSTTTITNDEWQKSVRYI